MSKFKKLYLLLLVSAAMNISNVYASAETDDTNTRTASSSSSDSSPASTFMPVQHSQFVTQVSDKPADYIITVPGKTYGEVSRILDFTFKSLGVRTPSVLNKIMEEYEASPSASNPSFLYCFKRDSNMVTVINTDSIQTVADIKFDSRPNCAILSGSKIYVFESSGNISIIDIGSDYINPYKIPYTEIRCGSNPRCVASIGNKLAVTCVIMVFFY